MILIRLSSPARERQGQMQAVAHRYSRRRPSLALAASFAA